jgi:hypothetical protein
MHKRRFRKHTERDLYVSQYHHQSDDAGDFYLYVFENEESSSERALKGNDMQFKTYLSYYVPGSVSGMAAVHRTRRGVSQAPLAARQRRTNVDSTGYTALAEPTPNLLKLLLKPAGSKEC